MAAATVADADVILGLDVPDLWYATHSMTPVTKLGMEASRTTKPGAKLIHIFSRRPLRKSNYQDFGRYAEVDLSIAADAEATSPALIEACKKLITADRKRRLRGSRQEATPRSAAQAIASAISSRRLRLRRQPHQHRPRLRRAVEPAQGRGLVAGLRRDLLQLLAAAAVGFQQALSVHRRPWRLRSGLWRPAAVGAALANRKHGRISVNIQCDGDLNYAPGVLWTAAHHQIPLLTIMHNNRAYHQELMYVQDMASRAQRGIDRAEIGTAITDPNIDYATMAKAYGMYSAGPIGDPKDLGPRSKPPFKW